MSAAVVHPLRVAGQEAVVSARFEATVDRGGVAAVSISYELAGGPSAVDLEALAFGEARPSGLRIDGARTDALRPTVGVGRRGSIELAPEQRDGFELSYTVDVSTVVGEDGFRTRIPVVTVDLPPGDDAVFSALVTVPEGWRILEGFPTGIGPGNGAVELAVVPSLVSARGSRSGRWSPGLPFFVQLFTFAVLAVAAGVGFRHLKGLSE